MSTSKFIRQAQAVTSTLRETPDGRLITLKGCKVYIPGRYLEKNLAQIGAEKYICGICAIVVDDKYYGVLMVNAMIGIEPTVTNHVEFDGDEYFEFVFDPGAVLINNLNLVQTDTIPYRIYDEYLSNGRVPWYVGMEDLADVYGTAKEHADANVGTEHAITELIVSLIARDPQDRSQRYRHTIKDKRELITRPPVYVPLASVHYSATNTVNKLAGNYFSEGVRSAIIAPASRVEDIENLLKA